MKEISVMLPFDGGERTLRNLFSAKHGKAREINLSRSGTTGIKCKHKSILVSSESERQKWCIHSEKPSAV